MRKFCSLVMGWCLERIDPEKREEWLFQMNAPLPGEQATKPSQSDLEEDAAAFLAAQRQFG